MGDKKTCLFCTEETTCEWRCAKTTWFLFCKTCREQMISEKRGCPQCREKGCMMPSTNGRPDFGRKIEIDELMQIFGEDALRNMNNMLYITFDAKRITFGISPTEEGPTRSSAKKSAASFAAAVTVIDGHEGCVMLTNPTQQFEWFSVEKRPTSSITEGGVDMARCFYIDHANQLTGAEIIPGSAARIAGLMKYMPDALNPVMVCHANDGSVVEILIASNPELPGILVRAYIPQLDKVAVAAVDLPANKYMQDDLPTFNDPRTMLIPWASGQLQLINIRTRITNSHGSSPLFPDELTKLDNGGVKLTYYVAEETEMSTYFACVNRTLPVHMFYYGLDAYDNQTSLTHEGLHNEWGFYAGDKRMVAKSELGKNDRADVWAYGTTSSLDDAKVIVQLANDQFRPTFYIPDHIKNLRIEARDQNGNVLYVSRRVDDITRVYRVYKSKVQSVYFDFTLDRGTCDQLCFCVTRNETPTDWRTTHNDVTRPFTSGSITKCIDIGKYPKGGVFAIARADSPADILAKVMVDFI